MRKLTAGNKKSFVTFSIIILGIIGLLIWCLTIALKVEKEEYTLEGSNFLYDEEYNPILSESTATVKMKWNGSYYLKEDSQEEEHKLGEQCLAYQSATRTLNLFGDMYRVYTDGSLAKFTKNNTISKISEDQLYKLADRKYLVVGNTITNQSGSLSTTGYLLILIDKAGNTFLLNNELNSRTLKPITIYTQTFSFDIANEKMIYGDTEIDLKKIIGSTNNYVEPMEKDPNSDKEAETNINNQTNINNDNSQTNINNQSTINNQQNNSATGVPTTNNNGQSKGELSRSVSLRGVSAGTTYIDIEYNIIDPESRYQTVYVAVEGTGEATIIALDKSENTYRVTGLNPNQEYKLTLGTKYVDSETRDVIENIEDVITARTKKLESTLKITKISLTQFEYHLSLDSDLNIDDADIVIYIDGIERERKKVNIDSAITNAGWDDAFTFQSGVNVLIRIENAKSDGKEVSLDLQAKAKIY